MYSKNVLGKAGPSTLEGQPNFGINWCTGNVSFGLLVVVDKMQHIFIVMIYGILLLDICRILLTRNGRNSLGDNVRGKPFNFS